ncbi:MAG TPA: SHOCT domain-containing protein [Candidatus Sulfotelmatobacter sp.]|nr:SHOCT domain-containing protein [Candidatus Sulfotelmatobacter sp.]
MLFGGGFSFANFLMDVLTVFAFVIWFWLAISVFSDLFQRHDVSGWGKALWVIGVILFPYLGVLVYMIAQGRGMAERKVVRAQHAREELRNVIGFSAADEIVKLDRLKQSGSISDDEFTRLRSKIVKAA